TFGAGGTSIPPMPSSLGTCAVHDPKHLRSPPGTREHRLLRSARAGGMMGCMHFPLGRRLSYGMYLLVAGVAACDPPNAGTDSSLPPPLTVSSDVVRSAPRDDAPVVELASGFNGAGFDLWRTQPVDGNLVFSPLSIGHALLMARAAAD